jgi:hypothetical protein
MPNRLFKLHQKSCQPLSISVWPGHRSVVSLGLQSEKTEGRRDLGWRHLAHAIRSEADGQPA